MGVGGRPVGGRLGLEGVVSQLLEVGRARPLEQRPLGLRVHLGGAGDQRALLRRDRAVDHLAAGPGQVAERLGRLDLALGRPERRAR